MKPKVTITDIAREAGVSAATVSRFLSGKATVSPETQARLLAVIHRYSYDTRNLSRALKKDRIRTIGVVIQQLGHLLYPGLRRPRDGPPGPGLGPVPSRRHR